MIELREASADTPSAAESDIATGVIAWQRRHGRHDLPWQRTRDPYRVWLSEIMLQQTQVATVLGYYTRFLVRFPDVGALAAAPLDDVLALWSGLGYYSRARNLHQCAQAVTERHGGLFPADSGSLAALPGIGRSTAAAIAAFCFGERAAILDGNVKRVLTRVLGFGEDLATATGERTLWSRAEALLPERDVDAYTQGLMDLGATVCTARQPRCGDCPLRRRCVAMAQGEPHRYPVKTRKLKRSQRSNALLWLQDGERLWLVRRPARGVWAALWCLPEFESTDEAAALCTAWPGQTARLPSIRHALTHFDWQLQPVHHALPSNLTDSQRTAIDAALPAGRWVGLGEALSMGLPAPVRKLLTTVVPT